MEVLVIEKESRGAFGVAGIWGKSSCCRQNIENTIDEVCWIFEARDLPT
jgi:hypothetical protein